MMEERWHRPGLVGPILLIVIGLNLLLSTLGLLQVSWWELWRLWPLILVLLGLDILSRHSRGASAAVAVVSLALVAGLFYLLATSPEPLRPVLATGTGSLVVHPVAEDLGEARRAEVDIRMGVGELHLSALGDSPHLLEGQLNYPERHGSAPHVSYRLDGDVGHLSLESRSRQAWIVPFSGSPGGESWTVGLSRQVPLSINLHAGASTSVLDLTSLQLTELRVKAGVGRVEVQFPAEGDRMAARVEGGVGEVLLRIPRSVAARIRIEGGLGSRQIDGRFTQVDGKIFESSGYDTAASRLEIVIEGGVGSLRVE
jgi:hypothetical protein